ncbi:MAG: imidazole glycerol phosphate synthase subunit HisH [Deltaproteobacteria bacterium]|nr:imidazole glycerol phosphate synthase subunit HisH [Deltaproteobacteria bacterium]
MRSVTIVNYGLGNIQAFVNIYKRLNIDAGIASKAGELLEAEKIILPGVGAFDWAMTRLNESGMRDVLDELVVDKKVPVLGICVGMQMMAKRSDEGVLAGLGWIDAEVKKFRRLEGKKVSEEKLMLPHMGWNDVMPCNTDCLFKNLGADARFYFLHSYYFHCNNQNDTIATTDYGIKYTSAANHKNIYGVQFHPEKSHSWGIQLLKNFAEI